jgi:hypothetical protein
MYTALWNSQIEGFREYWAWIEPDGGGDQMREKLDRYLNKSWWELSPSCLPEHEANPRPKDAADLARWVARRNAQQYPPEPPETVGQWLDFMRENGIFHPLTERPPNAPNAPAPLESNKKPKRTYTDWRALPLEDTQRPRVPLPPRGYIALKPDTYDQQLRLSDEQPRYRFSFKPQAGSQCHLGVHHNNHGLTLTSYAWRVGLLACTSFKHKFQPQLFRFVEMDPAFTPSQLHAEWKQPLDLERLANQQRLPFELTVREDPFFDGQQLADRLTPGSTILLSGPTCSGKSTAVSRAIRLRGARTALIITTTQSLVTNLTARFSAAELEILQPDEADLPSDNPEVTPVEIDVLTWQNHMSLQRSELKQHPRVALCLESILKASNQPYDVVFVDEVTEVLEDLDSKTMNKDFAQRISAFYKHLASADSLILGSSDCDQRTLALVTERILTKAQPLQQIHIPDRPLHNNLSSPQEAYYTSVIHPTLGPLPPPPLSDQELRAASKTPRSIVLLKQQRVFESKIIKAVKAGLRCAVYAGSKRWAKKLATALPLAQVKLISADNRRDARAMAADPLLWRNYPLVIYTGIVGVGVDISFEDDQHHPTAEFDLTFAYFHPDSGSVDHQAQALTRVRKLRLPLCYAFVAHGGQPEVRLNTAFEHLPLANRQAPTSQGERRQLRMDTTRYVCARNQLQRHLDKGHFEAQLIRKLLASNTMVYLYKPSAQELTELELVEDLPPEQEAQELLDPELTPHLDSDDYEVLIRQTDTDERDGRALKRFQLLHFTGCWDPSLPDNAENDRLDPDFAFNVNTLTFLLANQRKIKKLAAVLQPELREQLLVDAWGAGDPVAVQLAEATQRFFQSIGWDLVNRLPIRLDTSSFKKPQIDALRVCARLMPPPKGKAGWDCHNNLTARRACVRTLLKSLGLSNKTVGDRLTFVQHVQDWKRMTQFAKQTDFGRSFE